jgi:GNAT superfamily N-acetyltransferase
MVTKTPPAQKQQVEIGALEPDALEVAVAVLARGFAQEPGNLALWPDPNVRAAIWELGARHALEGALQLGTAHAATVEGDIAALALWDPPGTRTPGVATRGRHILDVVTRAPVLARGLPQAARTILPHVRAGLRLGRTRQAAIRSVSTQPVWHLAFLATAPEHRGRGLARRLLDRQLVRCDEDGLAVWLETTDPVNPPIYERFGFETVVHVADAAWLPGLWVMRREPRNPPVHAT